MSQHLPGLNIFLIPLAVVLVVVVFVVLILVVVVVLVRVVLQVEGSVIGLSLQCYEAGSAAFGFSRFGGGYVDQK